jgi:hypothetical protein
MGECLTKPILPEFSGCLVENPTCQFATRLGFSYLCEHPYHKEFHRGKESKPERIALSERYQLLRDERREKFLEGIGSVPIRDAGAVAMGEESCGFGI